MDPLEAIRGMTEVAAETVGLEGSGTLEPGTHADLLILDGDQAENPTLPNDPTAVVKGGDVVAGAIPKSKAKTADARR